ncbi:chromodomain helicase DNA binding protein chd1 swi2 snf2 [Cyclospora cayetanensis]|uniref:Chromodomain helicase DNA binding protein chd1 swi2 snf2 n=1 Tax=Cyclospora cayetanensis TaxID=88456 RepID=A0A1D3D4T8_9EIME|nr:chromodomain helicase DNA binding protein chd1 swi2 snf2 [Cyclospora cayetanensis]
MSGKRNSGGVSGAVWGGNAPTSSSSSSSSRRRKPRVQAREAYYASHLPRSTSVGATAAASAAAERSGSGFTLRARSSRVDYVNLAQDEEEGEESDDTEGGGTAGSGNNSNRYSAARGAGGEEAGAVAGKVVDRVLDSRLREDGEEEFLIKWLGRAHVHNTWEVYDSIAPLLGIKKLLNFIKRRDREKEAMQHMTPDEVEQLEIEKQMQRQLDEDALQAERIIYRWEDQQTGAKSYIVKWRSSPYDRCTQETHETLVQHDFLPLVDAYDARLRRVQAKLQKALSEPAAFRPITSTAFVPYVETPPYMNRVSPPEEGEVELEPEAQQQGELQAGKHEQAGDSSSSSSRLELSLGREADSRSNQELRDYQLTGVNWILSRLKRGVSVLLADEMGLGKTVQTIGVVGHLLFKEEVLTPILIFVPQSTLDNWVREFSRWLPEANVVMVHGNAAGRSVIRNYELQRLHHRLPVYKFDVCLTTPSILNCGGDSEFLKKVVWSLLVVDEAHQLKNINSKRFIELSAFSVQHKLFLSGTPLHNNLDELWNLLHFLNPSIHHSIAEFKQKYHLVEKHSEVGEAKAAQLAALQQELNGFILRRVKKDVERSMPKKVESILRVEMSPLQLHFYRLILTKNFDHLARKGGANRTNLQNICMELKKVCNHPFLCRAPEEGEEWSRLLVDGSAKIRLLDKLLKRLKEKGHRVLIFSQMVKMLNILAEFLKLRGYKHQRLDGTMPKEVRRKAMEQFNSRSSNDFCFLLSTKAGGLGINLTSADTVIIFDSDWNPQNDLQAEARAHRIGQTKTVQIYRLVTKDSIEQTILERAKAKMVLDTLVVQGLNKRGAECGGTTSLSGGASGLGAAFSREDLSKILKFGATKLWKQSRPKGCEEDGGPTGNGGGADEEFNSFDVEKPAAEVDLDLILAEAEVTVTEATKRDGGIADSLLSSYQNIQEFKYEPSEAAAAAENDAEFWAQCIPAHERAKLKKQTEEQLIVHGKRRTRNALLTWGLGGRADDSPERSTGGSLAGSSGYGVFPNSSGSFDEGDESAAVAAAVASATATGGRGRRGRRPRVLNPTQLTAKEYHRLYRALLRYGCIERRLTDIVMEAKLQRVSSAVVVAAAQQIVAACRERLNQAPSKPASAGGGSRKKAPLHPFYPSLFSAGACYFPLCLYCVSPFSPAGRSYFTQIGDTRVNAWDLIERLQLLTLLHDVFEQQNPGCPSPWRLPTGPLSADFTGMLQQQSQQQQQQLTQNSEAADAGDAAPESTEVGPTASAATPGSAASTAAAATASGPEALSHSPAGSSRHQEIAIQLEEQQSQPPQLSDTTTSGGSRTGFPPSRDAGRAGFLKNRMYVCSNGLPPPPPQQQEAYVGVGCCFFLQLHLPEGVISRLKAWSARDVQHWGTREDESLLIGAYKYGFGAWTEVSNDPNLCLPQIRDIKFDKLKMRALRTMKLLEKHLLQSSSGSLNTARPTRSLRSSPSFSSTAATAAPDPMPPAASATPDTLLLNGASQHAPRQNLQLPQHHKIDIAVTASAAAADDDEDEEDDELNGDQEGVNLLSPRPLVIAIRLCLAALPVERLKKAVRRLLRADRRSLKHLKKVFKEAATDNNPTLHRSAAAPYLPSIAATLRTALLPLGEGTPQYERVQAASWAYVSTELQQQSKCDSGFSTSEAPADAAGAATNPSASPQQEPAPMQLAAAAGSLLMGS